VVGDDHISISPCKEMLESILVNLESIDFKISKVDTYISKKIMFYCEETCMVPQSVSDVPKSTLARGEELIYVDSPRIKLILNTTSDVM